MTDPSYYAAFTRVREENLLLQRVCYLLGTGLVATAATAYASRDLSPGLALPFFLGTLACLVALRFAARVPVLNLVLFYAVSVLEGLLMGPVLAHIVRYVPNGAPMVSLAFSLSATVVAGVGMYVWCTGKDYSHLGKGLVIALWVAIGALVLAIFVPGLQTAPIQLLYSAAIVVLFTGFLFYDFSNIRHHYSADEYVDASINLYLDFVNLFWHILRIMLILTGNGRSRD